MGRSQIPTFLISQAIGREERDGTFDWANSQMLTGEFPVI